MPYVTRHTLLAPECLAQISAVTQAHRPPLHGLALVCIRDILGSQMHVTESRHYLETQFGLETTIERLVRFRRGQV